MTPSNDELLSLRDTLRKALGTAQADQLPAVDRDWRTSWSALAEMGLMAFCVPEDLGGFGNEVGAALVASRELGAALHGSPYPASIAAVFALSRWLDRALRDELVQAIASGTHVPSIAFFGPTVEVNHDAAEVHVDGQAPLVVGAEDADSFLAVGPEAGTMWFIPRGDWCAVSSAHSFDVTRSCADVVFTRAPAVPLAAPAHGRAEMELMLGLFLAGDALGGVEQMLERSTAYVRERKAFGKPIGGFQAVQHRLVDHAVRVRGMSLLAEQAATALGASVPGERQVALAEAAVSAGAVHVLHDLLQLTGAIAFTWEYGLHLYERRAHVDARLARNPRNARHSIARLEGWPELAR